MSGEEARREDFLERCMVECDTVAEALALARELEGFIVGYPAAPVGSSALQIPSASPANRAQPVKPSVRSDGAHTLRAGRVVFSPEQKQEFIRMAAKDASTAVLARKFGLRNQQVYQRKHTFKDEIAAMRASPAAGVQGSAPEGESAENMGSFEDANLRPSRVPARVVG